MVTPGMAVLVKPNLVGPYRPDRAATTHPLVLEGVLCVLRELGARVTVGESSMTKTRKALEVTGTREVALRYGAQVLDFDVSEYVEIQSGLSYVPRIPIAKAVIDADLVISVAKLKTHYANAFSGAVKNCFGVVPGRMKLQTHGLSRTKARFEQALVRIWQLTSPALSVIDGVIGMEGNGPTNGRPKHAGVLVAGRNAASVDMVAADLVGVPVADITYLTAAVRGGLAPRFEDLEVVGAPETVRFARPSYVMRRMDAVIESYTPWIYEKLLKPRVLIGESCRSCGVCVEACPEGALRSRQDMAPVLDDAACITCLCCQEACPSDAISARNRLGDRRFVRGGPR